MISLPFFPRNAPLLPEACYFSTCLLTIDEVHVRHALDPRQGQSGMAHERAKNMQKQINELVYLDKPIPSFYPTRWQDLPGQMADLAIFCARGVQKAIRAMGSVLSSLVACGTSAVAAITALYKPKDRENLVPNVPANVISTATTEPVSYQEAVHVPLINRHQHIPTTSIIPARGINCHSQNATLQIPGVRNLYYQSTGLTRTFGPTRGPESGRTALVSTLTTWQLPSDKGPSYCREASDLFFAPFTAQLMKQLGASAQALMFPDAQYQAMRAIEHGWDLSRFDKYRAALPEDKSQETCYLHAISAVITKTHVMIATQGNCMAHAVTGSEMRYLAGSNEQLGGLTQAQLDAAYGETSNTWNLPMRLSPDPHAKPTKPKVVAIPRAELNGLLLVLTTPGLHDALSTALGLGASASWIRSFISSSNTTTKDVFVGERFHEDSGSGAITVMDFSRNIEGE